ncbi:hypothetical protein, partial [Rubrivirga sp.]|uniref:hypothetical protein n=1 Tax=Rubrivirga sp. TaxID=1885344 RepID=UPI003C71E684
MLLELARPAGVPAASSRAVSMRRAEPSAPRPEGHARPRGRYAATGARRVPSVMWPASGDGPLST